MYHIFMTVNKDEDDLEDPVRTELISCCKKDVP